QTVCQNHGAIRKSGVVCDRHILCAVQYLNKTSRSSPIRAADVDEEIIVDQVVVSLGARIGTVNAEDAQSGSGVPDDIVRELDVRDDCPRCSAVLVPGCE